MTEIVHIKGTDSFLADIMSRMPLSLSQVSKVQNVKILGLMLDDILSWKPHVDHLECKLSSASFVLRTLRPLVSEGTLRTVYFSYIHSILSYGIIFWVNCSDSNKIFKLQKRAIIIITWSKNKESCRDFSRN
jgi:hypothetical protein